MKTRPKQLLPKRKYSSHSWKPGSSEELKLGTKTTINAARYSIDQKKQHLNACPFAGLCAADYQAITQRPIHPTVPPSAVFGPDGILHHMVDVPADKTHKFIFARQISQPRWWFQNANHSTT